MTNENVFSCDLVENARKHKWFLESIHELGCSINKPSNESLRRYQELWLPLVASKYNSDNNKQQRQQQLLIPPPDVAWMWHCHRLAPRDYVFYSRKHFGGVTLEANPPFTLQLVSSECEKESNAERTRSIWAEMYPNEPFFLLAANNNINNNQNEGREEEPAKSCLSGFDLLGSTERQGTFLWQVSGERFEDEDFLREGEKNYERFLRLKSVATEARVILVPTYQIDLMWHTHILSSITNYNKDCMVITGGPLHHDDSLTDRSSGGVLDKSYTATKDMWKLQYGTNYAVEGGMYRGEPPGGYFNKGWKASPDCQAGSNFHLIGLIGASSTSPALVWATKDDTVSSGEPAFIPTNTTLRHQLRSLEYRENYVLGKTTNGIGYWHCETKDFHNILYLRVKRRIQLLESDIACSRACCGATSEIVRKETELTGMHEVQKVIMKRMLASKPSGVIEGIPQKIRDNNNQGSNTGSHAYYDNHTGVWMYPPYLYDNCGGACGGNVVCTGYGDGGGGCGGSACGGGHGGGGDGGGGDGGGGCGGGNCGGGGCGGGG
eukprot:CAMPEP_0194200814 /NCGR_PEP_ID=MMETSP0156-20130528/1268_1 /TAXON_ID=33649 /ORGANISM="Thalassionema nitzschioides, Strain L26-B" /LENGTH=548 /DNA_ID=CAMNT_0038925867 /DNA_START=152 /DNA_END=1798 /DNA_ORIENTATION=+